MVSFATRWSTPSWKLIELYKGYLVEIRQERDMYGLVPPALPVGQHLEGGDIGMEGKAHLFQVIGALNAACGLACCLHRR